MNNVQEKSKESNSPRPLVVDANVMLSALIKESYTHTLLFSESFKLFTPEYIFTEFEKHKEEIIEKTKRTAPEFFRLIEVLRRRITIVPPEELIQYFKEAEQITPDPDDMIYFALALKLNCPIWSNDKKLKKQNRIKVYHTHELNKVNLS